jgi:hypothetical protein
LIRARIIWLNWYRGDPVRSRRNYFSIDPGGELNSGCAGRYCVRFPGDNAIFASLLVHKSGTECSRDHCERQYQSQNQVVSRTVFRLNFLQRHNRTGGKHSRFLVEMRYREVRVRRVFGKSCFHEFDSSSLSG